MVFDTGVYLDECALTFVFWCYIFQLDSDDAKVTFEEEQGVDVYDECPFP